MTSTEIVDAQKKHQAMPMRLRDGLGKVDRATLNPDQHMALTRLAEKGQQTVVDLRRHGCQDAMYVGVFRGVNEQLFIPTNGAYDLFMTPVAQDPEFLSGHVYVPAEVRRALRRARRVPAVHASSLHVIHEIPKRPRLAAEQASVADRERTLIAASRSIALGPRHDATIRADHLGWWAEHIMLWVGAAIAAPFLLAASVAGVLLVDPALLIAIPPDNTDLDVDAGVRHYAAWVVVAYWRRDAPGSAP